MIEFNLNQLVQVELTTAGKYHIIATKGKSWLYSKHVKGDWFRFQGHTVFELFPSKPLSLGQYMHMNIILETNS